MTDVGGRGGAQNNLENLSLDRQEGYDWSRMKLDNTKRINSENFQTDPKVCSKIFLFEFPDKIII